MPNADWMARLPDNRCLTQLAIPGTHDSGAYEPHDVPMTRAQYLSIPEQLTAGVRALDIRCAATWGSNRLLGTTYNVFHGIIDQEISVESVMTNVVDFLAAHPNEVVLVLLKQESLLGNISADINEIVNNTLGNTLYQRDSDDAHRWPLLGECRGRAVVLSRLANPHDHHYSTVGWPRNCVKARVASTQNYGVRIQDLFDGPQVADKKKAVSNALLDAKLEAHKGNRTQLFLNFASFVWAPWEPVWVGDTYMTPYLRTRPGGAGVICVDAVTEQLASHIISMNR
jgi:1-phosphatidylinositol phosphodiesterase